MRDEQHWRLLETELDRWQSSGRTARFWLRDDDAVAPTEALEKLIGLTGDAAVPLMLAVIPELTGAPLAEHLAASGHVTVAVHGWSHQNHAGPSDKKQELGSHRAQSLVLDELARGFDKLSGLYGPQFTAMLVPPWNRIDASLLPHLAVLGFTSVSVFGKEKPALISMINTHVDLMDWHGSRGGRERGQLIAEIVARLQVMFDHGGHMGFLTHHLVHDEAAWQFIDSLMARSSAHPACRWVAPSELLYPDASLT